MSDDFSQDGQPIQAGLQHRSVVLGGNVPAYSMFGLHEMVVVGRTYVKQRGNRSRSQVEYACRDIVTGDILIGCRRLDVMSGLTNGDDNVLHPAGKLRAGASGKFSRQTPAQDTDGDRVLVGFIEGSRQRPVIIGVFRHTFADYGATESDGERRLTTHQGTTIEIKSNGQYVLVGAADVSFDGTQVLLGANAVQAVIRGNDFGNVVLTPINSAAAALLATMATIPGMMLPIPTPVNIAGAVNAIATAISAFSSALESAINTYPTTLSTKVKTE